MNEICIIVSRHNSVTVLENPATGQRSLHAARAFQKGEIVTTFEAEEELFSPTHLTLQKDDGLHITLSPSFLQYVNHSCSPNAFFNTSTMQFVALENVAEGQELTFFYPSAEWQMARAFLCHCQNSNCLRSIQGAAFLPNEILQQYRLTDFILRKLAQRGVARA